MTVAFITRAPQCEIRVNVMFIKTDEINNIDIAKIWVNIFFTELKRVNHKEME